MHASRIIWKRTRKFPLVPRAGEKPLADDSPSALRGSGSINGGDGVLMNACTTEIFIPFDCAHIIGQSAAPPAQWN